MGLREWALGGILLSPLLICVLLALGLTMLVRLALQRSGLSAWIWHEALFDTALFVCVLALVCLVLFTV